MKLATISSQSRCYQCYGTGIRSNITVVEGRRTIGLTVCDCVTVRHVKPKTFAEEVAKELGRRKGGKQ